MSARTQADAASTFTRGLTANDASLIAQLRRVHGELRSTVALAAQTPPGERYDAALQLLYDEINTLGREFLSLSEELLARGNTTATRGSASFDPA